jgi:peptide-methionine (S)-S-oxide reductase
MNDLIQNDGVDHIENESTTISSHDINNEIAIFAGGCFWCTEAFFKNLKGVLSVVPGYTGGEKPNPSYEEVCTGETGHAEAIMLEYDPSIISYQDLLSVFFATHDPTAKNRQGNDVGTQYRSAIFYIGPHQKNAAKDCIKELESKKVFNSPIVTQMLPLQEFFPAEDYHKNYFETHKEAPYCQIVIGPKVAKLRQTFKRLLKD